MENNQELTLNETSINYLKETAKWSHFLSILGFISLGFIILIAFFIKAIFSFIPNSGQNDFGANSFPFMIMSFVYIIIALIYFFPILYLYNFSKKIKTAIQKTDNNLLEDAFKNLKSHYKFIGIFMAIILSLYLLIFIGSIFTMALFR